MRQGLSGRGLAVVGLAGIGLATVGMAGAAGACPSGSEDAARGVTVVYDDGSVSHYWRNADGVVVEEALFDDPEIDGYRVYALHGLYVLEEYDLVGGAPDPASRDRQSFAVALKDLPLPAPGLSWQGVVEVTMEGEPPFARTVTVVMRQPETVSYGACSYESWPVLLRHQDEVEDLMIALDYLPALEITVFRGFAEVGGEVDRYTPVSIELRAP